MDPYQLTAQPFDAADPKNMGRPVYFNLDMYLAVVEQMISADEVERALWMLDNLPGWYRDNTPVEVKLMRNHLLKKLYNTIDYSNIEYNRDIELDAETTCKLVFQFHRMRELKTLVERLRNPYIVEMAPGGYMIPKGFKASNIKLEYLGLGLGTTHKINTLEDTHTTPIFVAFELIEHLHNPVEIYQCALKTGIDFHYICLSTPLYSWKGGNPKWYAADLGHLRTYTPDEFLSFARKYWPQYEWTITLSDEMYLQGKRTI